MEIHWINVNCKGIITGYFISWDKGEYNRYYEIFEKEIELNVKYQK